MSRKSSPGPLAYLIVIGLLVAAVSAFSEAIGLTVPQLGLVGVGVFVLAISISTAVQAAKVRRRRNELMAKYGDDELVAKLMGRTIWKGMEAPMVYDCLGPPLAVDRQVLKTKTKETWKYKQTGQNKYGLHIVLEQGEVVGWTDKG